MLSKEKLRHRIQKSTFFIVKIKKFNVNNFLFMEKYFFFQFAKEMKHVVKKLNRILLKHHKTEQNFLTIKKVLLIIK